MALLPIQNMLLGMRIDPRLLLGANEADVSLPGDIGVLGGQAPGVYQTPPLWGMGYPDYGLTEGGEFGATAYPQVMPGDDGGAGAGARGGGTAPDYSSEFTPGDIPSQYPRPSSGAASGDGFNPWQLALLAAGSELLKGSGWSRYPVATGQALGSAGQAGLGTYMQAKREQDRSALAREQIEAMRGTRQAQIAAAEQLTKQREDTVARKQERDRIVRNIFGLRQRMTDPSISDALRAEAKAEFENSVMQLVAMDTPKELLDIVNPKPQKDSALQEKISTIQAQLLREGWSEQDAQTAATNMGTGRWVWSRDPTSEMVTIVDVATGREVMGRGRPGAGTPGAAAPAGGQAQAAVGGQQPQKPIDPTAPFGVMGQIRRGVNKIVDWLGGGTPAAATEEARQALDLLRQGTIAVGQASVPGRPSNWAMQMTERGMVIDPNEFMAGPESARKKMVQTRDYLKLELDRMQNDILGRPQFFTPAQRAETEMNVTMMKQLIEQYDALIGGIGYQEKRKPLNEIFKD